MSGSLSLNMPEATPTGLTSPHVAPTVIDQTTNQLSQPASSTTQSSSSSSTQSSSHLARAVPHQHQFVTTATSYPNVYPNHAYRAIPHVTPISTCSNDPREMHDTSGSRPSSYQQMHRGYYPAIPHHPSHPNGLSVNPSRPLHPTFIDLTGSSSLSPPATQTRPAPPLQAPSHSNHSTYELIQPSVSNTVASSEPHPSRRSPPSLQQSASVFQSASTSLSVQSSVNSSANLVTSAIAVPIPRYEPRCNYPQCGTHLFKTQEEYTDHVRRFHAPPLNVIAGVSSKKHRSKTDKPAKADKPPKDKQSRSHSSTSKPPKVKSSKSKPPKSSVVDSSATSVSAKKKASRKSKSENSSDALGQNGSSDRDVQFVDIRKVPSLAMSSTLQNGPLDPIHTSLPLSAQARSAVPSVSPFGDASNTPVNVTSSTPSVSHILSLSTEPPVLTPIAEALVPVSHPPVPVSESLVHVSEFLENKEQDSLQGLDNHLRHLVESNSVLYVQKWYLDRPVPSLSDVFQTRVRRLRRAWRQIFDQNHVWPWDAQTDQGQQIRDVMAGKLKGYGKGRHQAISTDAPTALLYVRATNPQVESRKSTRPRRATVVFEQQPTLSLIPTPRRKKTIKAPSTAVSPHMKSSHVISLGSSDERAKFLHKHRAVARRRAEDDMPPSQWYCAACGLQQHDKYGCLLRCSGPCHFAYHQRCIEMRDIPSGRWWCSEECLIGSTQDEVIALKVVLRWRNRNERKKRFGLESFDQPTSNSNRGSRPSENSWLLERATTEPLAEDKPCEWSAAFAALSATHVDSGLSSLTSEPDRRVMKPLSLLAVTTSRDQPQSSTQSSRSRKLSLAVNPRVRTPKSDDVSQRSNKTNSSGNPSQRSLRSSSSMLPRRPAAYLISLRVLDRDPNHAICCVCEDGESVEDNEIILCDGPCSCAYHRYCANLDTTPGEDDEWCCSLQCGRAKADNIELSSDIIVQLIQAARDSYEQRGPYVEASLTTDTQHQIRAFYDEVERDYFCPRVIWNTFKRGNWRPSKLGVRAMAQLANLILECASDNVDDPAFKFSFDDEEKLVSEETQSMVDDVANIPTLPLALEQSNVPVSLLTELSSLPSRQHSSPELPALDEPAEETSQVSLSNSNMLVTSDKAKIAAWIQNATLSASSSSGTRTTSSIMSSRSEGSSPPLSSVSPATRSTSDVAKLAQFAAVLEAPVKSVDEGDRLLAAYYAQVAINNQTKQHLFEQLMKEELSNTDTFCRRQLQDELTIREYLEHEEKTECGTLRDRAARQQKPYVSYCRCSDCLMAADKALRDELNNQYLRDHPHATMLPHKMPVILRKNSDGEEIEVEIVDSFLEDFQDLQSFQLPEQPPSLAVEATIDSEAMAAALDDGVKQRKRVIEFARAIGNPELLELVDGCDKTRPSSRASVAAKKRTVTSTHPNKRSARSFATPKLESTRRGGNSVDHEPMQAHDFMEFTSPGQGRRALNLLSPWGWEKPGGNSSASSRSRRRRASAMLPPGLRIAHVSFDLDGECVRQADVIIKARPPIALRQPPVIHTVPTLKTEAEVEVSIKEEAAQDLVPLSKSRVVHVRLNSILIFSCLPLQLPADVQLVTVTSILRDKLAAEEAVRQEMKDQKRREYNQRKDQRRDQEQAAKLAELMKLWSRVRVDPDGEVVVEFEFTGPRTKRLKREWFARVRQSQLAAQANELAAQAAAEAEALACAGESRRSLRHRSRLSCEGEDQSDTVMSEGKSTKYTSTTAMAVEPTVRHTLELAPSVAPVAAAPVTQEEAVNESVRVGREKRPRASRGRKSEPAQRTTRARSGGDAQATLTSVSVPVQLAPAPVVLHEAVLLDEYLPALSLDEVYSRYTDDQLYHLGLTKDVETDICRICSEAGDLLCCDGEVDGRRCTWLYHQRCLNQRKSDRRGQGDSSTEVFICPRHRCAGCQVGDKDALKFNYCEWCDRSLCGKCYPQLSRIYPMEPHIPIKENISFYNCFACARQTPSNTRFPWVTREYMMRLPDARADAYRAYLIWLGKKHLDSMYPHLLPPTAVDTAQNYYIPSQEAAAEPLIDVVVAPLQLTQLSATAAVTSSDLSIPSVTSITSIPSVTPITSVPSVSSITSIPSVPSILSPKPKLISPRPKTMRETLMDSSDDDDELLTSVVLSRRSVSRSSALRLLRSPPPQPVVTSSAVEPSLDTVTVIHEAVVADNDNKVSQSVDTSASVADESAVGFVDAVCDLPAVPAPSRKRHGTTTEPQRPKRPRGRPPAVAKQLDLSEPVTQAAQIELTAEPVSLSSTISLPSITSSSVLSTDSANLSIAESQPSAKLSTPPASPRDNEVTLTDAVSLPVVSLAPLAESASVTNSAQSVTATDSASVDTSLPPAVPIPTALPTAKATSVVTRTNRRASTRKAVVPTRRSMKSAGSSSNSSSVIPHVVAAPDAKHAINQSTTLPSSVVPLSIHNVPKLPSWPESAMANSTVFPVVPLPFKATALRPTTTRNMSEIPLNAIKQPYMPPTAVSPPPIESPTHWISKQNAVNLVNKITSLIPPLSFNFHRLGLNKTVEPVKPLLLTPCKQRGPHDMMTPITPPQSATMAIELPPASPILPCDNQSINQSSAQKPVIVDVGSASVVTFVDTNAEQSINQSINQQPQYEPTAETAVIVSDVSESSITATLPINDPQLSINQSIDQPTSQLFTELVKPDSLTDQSIAIPNAPSTESPAVALVPKAGGRRKRGRDESINQSINQDLQPRRKSGRMSIPTDRFIQ